MNLKQKTSKKLFFVLSFNAWHVRKGPGLFEIIKKRNTKSRDTVPFSSFNAHPQHCLSILLTIVAFQARNE